MPAAVAIMTDAIGTRTSATIFDEWLSEPLVDGDDVGKDDDEDENKDEIDEDKDEDEDAESEIAVVVADVEAGRSVFCQFIWNMGANIVTYEAVTRVLLQVYETGIVKSPNPITPG
jgi:hypothetical protein